MMKTKIAKFLSCFSVFFLFLLLPGLCTFSYCLENPENTAYISALKGKAYAKSASSDEYGLVEINIPLEEKDELITGENSYTELSFSTGSVVWVAAETYLSIDNISTQPSVTLLQGTLLIKGASSNSDKIFTFVDTPIATIQIQHNSLVKICLDNNSKVTVDVLEGKADAYLEKGSVGINEGKTVLINASGYIVFTSLPDNSAKGDFEKWCLNENKKITENTSSEYLKEDLTGTAQLNDYGQWVYERSISRYVWTPFVSYTWRPYLYGRWIYRPGGYYWVSYEPWGWTPYHYGRWYRNRRGRWCWIPGYRFSPAWVVFISFGSYYAWAPVGFGYYPYYYPYYYANGMYYYDYYSYPFITGCNSFVFVDKDCFDAHHDCKKSSKSGYQPLTENDIDSKEKIIHISEPLKKIERVRKRFTIPDRNDNFPGTILKNISDRIRSNIPRQGIQPVRSIRNRKKFPAVTTGNLVKRPEKRIDYKKRILQRKKTPGNLIVVRTPQKPIDKKMLTVPVNRKKRAISSPLKKVPERTIRKYRKAKKNTRQIRKSPAQRVSLTMNNNRAAKIPAAGGSAFPTRSHRNFITKRTAIKSRGITALRGTPFTTKSFSANR